MSVQEFSPQILLLVAQEQLLSSGNLILAIICDWLPENRPFAKKKMKIHFLASVRPKFIRKYDEPLSIFLRRFSAKIQTKSLHAFSPINRSFLREKSLYSEMPKVRKFLRVTVTPTFTKKMAVCLLKPRSL